MMRKGCCAWGQSAFPSKAWWSCDLICIRMCIPSDRDALVSGSWDALKQVTKCFQADHNPLTNCFGIRQLLRIACCKRCCQKMLQQMRVQNRNPILPGRCALIHFAFLLHDMPCNVSLTSCYFMICSRGILRMQMQSRNPTLLF